MLKDAGRVSAAERVVLVLTGAGIKYEPPETPTPVDLEGPDEAIIARVRSALNA